VAIAGLRQPFSSPVLLLDAGAHHAGGDGDACVRPGPQGLRGLLVHTDRRPGLAYRNVPRQVPFVGANEDELIARKILRRVLDPGDDLRGRVVAAERVYSDAHRKARSGRGG
jgi:hypothetical protein